MIQNVLIVFRLSENFIDPVLYILDFVYILRHSKNRASFLEKQNLII